VTIKLPYLISPTVIYYYHRLIKKRSERLLLVNLGKINTQDAKLVIGLTKAL